MPAMTERTAPRAKRQAAGDRRREREAMIIAATRRLFDESGVRDAQIEDVARAVGLNRAIIYRHFTGKEELFALAEADYLKDLEARLAAADDPALDAETRLGRITGAFLDFGLEHPAFVDCGVTILRMGPALLEELSSSALSQLGRGMTACLARVVDVIAAGKDTGVFDVDDVDLVANLLYALGLGGLQLARLGVMVREDSPGNPGVVGIDQPRLKEHLMTSSLALVRPVVRDRA
jgi:AcrR family transcriptional regulator